jgi:hypothetical protein
MRSRNGKLRTFSKTEMVKWGQLNVARIGIQFHYAARTSLFNFAVDAL